MALIRNINLFTLERSPDMHKFSTFALSLLTTLAASSLFAQCPLGSPCAQRNYGGGSSGWGGNYSYSSPNTQGQSYYQNPSYGRNPYQTNYAQGPYEINYPSYPQGDQGFYHQQGGMEGPTYYDNQPNWSQQGYQGQQMMNNTLPNGQTSYYTPYQPTWSQQQQPSWYQRQTSQSQGQRNWGQSGQSSYYSPNQPSQSSSSGMMQQNTTK